MAEAARTGKIASLPAKIREEVNQRLHDGETARQILPWLNAHSDVLRILDERWGEEPVTPQNLSEWRRGGHQDWLRRNEKIEAIKVLSGYCYKLAEAAGGSMTKGMVAIAGGRIMEALESSAGAVADEATGEADGAGPLPINELIESLVKLRSAEVQERRTDQRDVVLSQRDRQLALEEQKFQRGTAEYFVKFYEDRRAKEIMEMRGSKDVKMDQLVTLMFGKKPESEPDGR